MMDIFSLGCVCYYMLTRGRHPFGEEDNREVSTSFPSSHSRAMSEGGTFTDR
jgi:serine/threonine protein kinase